MKQLIEITADQAKQILLTYRNDKKPDRRKVEWFKQIIKSGKWDAKRHTRILMIKGILKNGKHRLTAISELDKPVMIKLDTQ